MIRRRNRRSVLWGQPPVQQSSVSQIEAKVNTLIQSDYKSLYKTLQNISCSHSKEEDFISSPFALSCASTGKQLIINKFHTVVPKSVPERVKKAIKEKRIDSITFSRFTRKPLEEEYIFIAHILSQLDVKQIYLQKSVLPEEQFYILCLIISTFCSDLKTFCFLDSKRRVQFDNLSCFLSKFKGVENLGLARVDSRVKQKELYQFLKSNVKGLKSFQIDYSPLVVPVIKGIQAIPCLQQLKSLRLDLEKESYTTVTNFLCHLNESQMIEDLNILELAFPSKRPLSNSSVCCLINTLDQFHSQLFFESTLQLDNPVHLSLLFQSVYSRKPSSKTNYIFRVHAGRDDFAVRRGLVSKYLPEPFAFQTLGTRRRRS
eukprot:snap_masked-scaffold_42-processed-gene-2.15-mRNA-1 protein AED:1.00 eAED:1.00 QI:0/-1/0/0/-1/1/1/0/372